ncbi:short transient receptor potential channel 4-like [Stylophora pistillata]|uniref:short transient receptor potential channel 4-like n=1 Tax=Stylophora pistillata TaxID=50429 RepID=UPI000C03B361|nr:short transient receptor potential channel 4-like [Stylophora pistillata]
MAQTKFAERNVRSAFAEFLRTIQRNNNEETDEFLSSVTETAGTQEEEREADSQQDLSAKLEDALRKSDVNAIYRLIANAKASETTTTAKDTEKIKTLASLQVAERNKTEPTDLIEAALGNACLLEKISSNERHFDGVECRERAKECEKFATDIVEQINAADSGNLYKIMDIKGDGPLLKGNHENFIGSLSLLKIAADRQRKLFVTSPKCQLIFDEVVYREWPMWYDKGLAVKTLRFLFHFIVMSFGIIAYLFLRLIMRGCCCCKLNEKEGLWRLRKLYELPYSKFINQTMSYLVFLCLVFASTFQTKFGTTKTGLGAIDYAVLTFVVGLSVQEAMEAYRQGLSIYFLKWWNVVDTLITFTFLLAYIVWLSAWGYYEQEWKPRKAAFIVADGIYATATVLSYFHLAHIFQVNSVLGPLQLSLYRMLKDVLKFLAIFLLLYIAFATGVVKIYSYYVACQLELQKQDYNESTKYQVSHPYGRHTGSFIGMFWLLLGMVEEEKIAVDDPAFYLTSTFGRIFIIGHVICTVIVALNMLIAMMNNSFDGIMENAILEWKFSRTQMWLEWIDKGNSIPVPFNTAYYILYIFTPNFWKTCCKTRCKNAGEGGGTKEEIEIGRDNHGAQTDLLEAVSGEQTRMEVMKRLVEEYLVDRYVDKWAEHKVNTRALRP